MFRKILPFVLGFILIQSLSSFAQEDDRDLDQIEAEIKKVEIKASQNNSAKDEKEVPDVKVENLSDLSKLQPFSEVSVMQKRYMPKSMRFQLFGGFAAQVNDPWNNVMGGNLRASFGITEAWGIEATSYFLSYNSSQAAQDLYTNHNVNAKSFGVSTGYTGGQVMWTPIYGKLSLLNKRIIPFDMYFSAGGGTTTLEGSTVASASTTSLSTGQIFALTKSVSFRWDLTWNMYSMPIGTVNSLLLTFGAGWYIPEAGYR